jgi:hypothetical protein
MPGAPRGLLMADIVEKVRCRGRAHFLRTSDTLGVARRGGPRRPAQNRSAIFLALPRGLFLPQLA